MPTYEYRCKDCRHDLEAVQAFTDDALTECPACGGLLKKRFGSVGITFKGSGFYKNDSRTSTSTGTTAGESSGSSSESGSKAESSGSTSESSGSSSGASSSSGDSSKAPAATS
jgi:putative FmdB family regulatory protein